MYNVAREKVSDMNISYIRAEDTIFKQPTIRF